MLGTLEGDEEAACHVIGAALSRFRENGLHLQEARGNRKMNVSLSAAVVIFSVNSYSIDKTAS